MSSYLEATFLVLMGFWSLVGITQIMLNIKKINSLNQEKVSKQLSKKELEELISSAESIKNNDLTKPFGLDESEDDPADWWKRQQEND